MRPFILTAVLLASAAAVAVASAQPRAGGQELTLFEQPNFGGRQFTYYGPSNDVARQGFRARSARTNGGVWTVCQSADPRGPCDTISGSNPSLSLNVAVVRPGRQELTLFEQPNLGGRQFTYYGASRDVAAQGFPARSARSSGDPWSVCGPSSCVVVTGEMRSLNVGGQVTAVEPGRNGRPTGGGGGRWDDRGGRGDDRGGRGDDRGGRGDDRWDENRGGGRGDRWDDNRDGRGDRWDDRGGRGDDIVRVRYDCTGGRSLRATFDNDNDTVELRLDGGEPVVLEQARSGSGFRYLGRAREFTGKGRDATYVVGRAAPIQCRER